MEFMADLYLGIRFKYCLLIILVLAGVGFAGTYSGGLGTADDPFILSDVNDILELTVSPNDFDDHFVLVNDINLAGETFSNSIAGCDQDDNLSGFQGSGFSGVFNGNKYSISNLDIYAPGTNYIAFFGKIENGAQVKDLTFIDLKCKGKYYVASIAGLCQGEITRCVAIGTVESTAEVAGGIVGVNNEGQISESSFEGRVSGMGKVGGFMGATNDSESLVENCFTTAEVIGIGNNVGGFVGYVSVGKILKCYSAGEVIGGDATGGFSGYCINTNLVEDCFWDVNTSKLDTSSTGVGLTTEEMQDADSFISSDWDFYGESVNGVNDIWFVDVDSYPTFMWNLISYTSGSGTEGDPYLISRPKELWGLGLDKGRWDRQFLLANDINMLEYDFSDSLIGADGSVGFAGVFDGNGFVIENLRINSDIVDCNLGLFGKIVGGAVLKNIILRNCDVNALHCEGAVGGLVAQIESGVVANCLVEGIVAGKSNVGMICGENVSGVVERCSSDGVTKGDNNIGGIVGINHGDVVISNSCVSIDGGVSGIGGIVGLNVGGAIKKSFYNGAIAGPNEVNAIGGISGSNFGNVELSYSNSQIYCGDNASFVGGFCGYNGGYVYDCYAKGNVNTGSNSDKLGGFCGFNDQGEIYNCYSIVKSLGGAGTSNRGGFCGLNNSVIENSFWDRMFTVSFISSGGEGLNTSAMVDTETYLDAGWDFSSIDGDEADWYLDNDIYPVFRWQISDYEIFFDGEHDMKDFAVLSKYWLCQSCDRYNDYCGWADLDFSGDVGVEDLIGLMVHWLEVGYYLD